MTSRIVSGVCVAVLLWAVPLAAQEDASATAEPARTHVVRDGDTLWELARRYLNDPLRWPAIYRANQAVVEDPHWIYPHERLRIPGAEAPVRTVSTRGVRRTRFYDAPAGDEREGLEGPRMIQSEDSRRRAVGPAEFHTAPWLARPQRLPVVGRLVALAEMDPARVEDYEEHISAHSFDEVFLTYASANRPEPGDRLLLVHKAREVDGWGRLIEPTAILTVESLGRDGFTATVTEHFGRAMAGNLALPLERLPPARSGAAERAGSRSAGTVITFQTEQPMHGLGDYAFINFTGTQRPAIGDVLVAYVRPRRDDGVTLPSRRVARLLVVRVGARSATARITNIRRAALEPGLPVRTVPTRR